MGWTLLDSDHLAYTVRQKKKSVPEVSLQPPNEFFELTNFILQSFLPLVSVRTSQRFVKHLWVCMVVSNKGYIWWEVKWIHSTFVIVLYGLLKNFVIWFILKKSKSNQSFVHSLEGTLWRSYSMAVTVLLVRSLVVIEWVHLEVQWSKGIGWYWGY